MIRLGNIDLVRHESLVEVPSPKPKKATRKEQVLGCPYPDNKFNIISVTSSPKIEEVYQTPSSSLHNVHENIKEETVSIISNNQITGEKNIQNQDRDTGVLKLHKPLNIELDRNSTIHKNENNREKNNVDEIHDAGKNSKGLITKLKNFFKI